VNSDPPPDPAFQVSTTEEGSSVVVTVAGEVDMDNHRELGKALARAVDRTAGDVVVDLGLVSFLDSTGVRTLLRGWQEAGSCGITLALRNPQPAIVRVLRVTGVAEMLGLST
jgi:anti-anti-sigma factor